MSVVVRANFDDDISFFLLPIGMVMLIIIMMLDYLPVCVSVNPYLLSLLHCHVSAHSFPPRMISTLSFQEVPVRILLFLVVRVIYIYIYIWVKFIRDTI